MTLFNINNFFYPQLDTLMILLNINNLLAHHGLNIAHTNIFICKQLNGFKYCYII